MGEEVTLADFMIYPWLERWPVVTETYGITIPAECKKLLVLGELIGKRESVLETKKETSLEFYL